MDPMEQIKATFFQECEDLLADLETGLLSLQAGEGDGETVNAIFRAVHSVKGGAGAFGLDALVGFAHVFETTLDLMRSGKLAAEGEAVSVLLRAADVLADLVAAARSGESVPADRVAETADELSAISGIDAPHTPGGGDPADDGDIEGLDFVPQVLSFDAPAEDAAASRVWTIHVTPKSEMYANANDIALVIREIASLGQCSVEISDDGLPDFDALDPEQSYLSWTITLESDCPEARIRDAFEFIDHACDFQISAAGAEETAPADVGDILRALMEPQQDAAPASKPEPAPEPAGTAHAPAKPDRDETAGGAREGGPQAAPAQAPSGAATIRVDLERVDRLIDLVGELVINQAMLAERLTDPEISRRTSSAAMALEDLEQLTREIQDSCMAIRAQPVKSVFQRMPRLVRETASMCGKQVRLITEGEGTEVDKTVIERLTEPLTHMVRNAVDHGLETPEQRLAAGKSSEGVVKLAAKHRSGRIVIEISDDGRGINRERVRQKAIDNGLIDPSAQLTNEEIDNLIFAPGFSTASAVTDVSGRGVGMDVVKRSIAALGGRISISSEEGKGSVFTMSLPLTLAVLDGMVVTCAGQTLVTPIPAIVESLKPKPGDIKRIGPNGYVYKVRDSYVPVVDLGIRLGFRRERLDPQTSVAILVEGESGGRVALLVDAIQGQRQVVIKSLEANYRRVEGVAAATIMGDGRVALILDVDALIATARISSSINTPTLAKAS